MDVTLRRPDGLDDIGWDSIDSVRERLQRAVEADDRPLVIGSAKELVEATAHVVLRERGIISGSNEDYEPVVSRAHAALGRQPGPGLADDPTVREIALGAKRIAVQLREIRNRYGTGHGRAAQPSIADELFSVCVDAALLWSRWALRRLEHLIAGQPSALAADLRAFKTFRRGDLAKRLVAANLRELEPEEQHLLGAAVAHRAMQGTGVVIEDGVTPCAESSDTTAWPPGYRAGLAEGFFLNGDGYVHATAWSVTRAAMILANHPGPDETLANLATKIEEAGWSTHFADDTNGRRDVIATMVDVGTLLPSTAQASWTAISNQVGPPTSTDEP